MYNQFPYSASLIVAAVAMGLGAQANAQPETRLSVSRINNSGIPSVTVSTYPAIHQDVISLWPVRYDITASADGPGTFGLAAWADYRQSNHFELEASASVETTVTDVIVTVPGDPGATGDVLMAVRFHYDRTERSSANSWSTSAHYFAQKSGTGLPPTVQIIPVGSGTIISDYILVPLNTEFGLVLYNALHVSTFSTGAHDVEGEVQTELASTPFVFMDVISGTGNYTVNSVSLEVIDNTYGVAQCQADLTDDGVLDFFDVSLYLNYYAANDLHADFNIDGQLDFFDVSSFLAAFAVGCP